MYCTNCGHKNEDGAKFCAGCGKALGIQVAISKPVGGIQRKARGNRKAVSILIGLLAITCALIAIFFVTRKVEYDSVDPYNKFGLAKAELKGKYGYIDAKEKEVISVKYEEADDFTEDGLVKVKSAGKTGVYTYTGEEVIPTEYEMVEIGTLNNDSGLIPIYLDDSPCFLGKDFNNAFTEISDTNVNGYYVVNDGEDYGCIQTNGNYILPCDYESIELEYVNNGKIKVLLDGKPNYISLSGTVLYDSVGESEENGWTLVEKESKYGYINKDGQEIIPCQYSKLSLGEKQANGYVPINMDGINNFVDENGRMLYTRVGSYGDNGLAVACDKYNNYGYIDETGETVIDFQFVEAGDFGSNSLARVKQGSYWGYVNKLGVVAVKIIYDEAEDFNDLGYARVKYGNVYNFISEMGVEEYEYVDNFVDDVAIAKLDGRYGLVKRNGELLTDIWYDMIYDEQDFRDAKLFKARKDGKYVLLGTDGLELSEYYDGIGSKRFGKIVFWNDGKYGLMSQNGEITTEAEFNFIEFGDAYLEYDVICEFTDDSIYFVDDTGKILAQAMYKDILNWLEETIYEPDFVIGESDSGFTAIIILDGAALIYSGDGIWTPLYKEYEVVGGYGGSDGCYVILTNNKGYLAIGDVEGKMLTGFDFEDITECRRDSVIAQKNGKMGVSDCLGNTIIDYDYNYIQFCKEDSKLGYVLAQNVDGKYGCLDKEGHEIIPFGYEELHEVEGFLTAKVNGEYGVLNRDLDWVIPAEYDALAVDANGYFFVSQDGYSGILDQKGNVKIDPYYDNIEVNLDKTKDEFYGLIQSGDYYGVVNKDYEIVIQPEYVHIDIFPQYDYVCRAVTMDGEYNLINKTGEVLISGASWISEVGTDGYVAVSYYGDTSYICDTKSTHWVSTDYGLNSGINYGLVAAYKDGYFGYVDLKGELAINCIYENVRDFSADGLAAVCDGGYWGYINEKGESVIPCQYAYAEDFQNGYAVVMKENEKEGVIDVNGDIIVPTDFDSVYIDYQGRYFWAESGEKTTIIGRNGYVILSTNKDLL